MSHNKLRGAIREKYGTQEAFAEAMKMNPATLSGRLTGKTDWSKTEMEKAAILLGINIEVLHTYFFSL